MPPTSIASVLERAANAFPIWVAAACSLALVEPALFAWFKGEAIVVGLAVIMLGMGMTLSLDDFGRVAVAGRRTAAHASPFGDTQAVPRARASSPAFAS